MEPTRRYQVGNLVVAAVAVGHALGTWSTAAVVGLFVGGAAIAFVAEAVVVALGLLDHAIDPQIAGVPVSVVLVWPAITYVCLRIALVVVPVGLAAAAVAAAIGTAFDLVTEPFGVGEGIWRYPEHPLSTPRFLGIPWWNTVGWFALVFVTASLPIGLGV